MANEMNQIALFEKPLFTWYKLPLSIDRELDFPAESCFAYILEGDKQDLTDSGFLAEKGTVILSLCGKTVGNSLSKIETAFLSTIIVHFDREVLKKVFNYEKPKFWKELKHPIRKDIAQQDASALVRAYFLNIADLFNHKNALNEDILSVKLKEIVLLLLQTQESSNLNAIVRSLFSDRVFSFQEVIETNLYEPLNLNRLASMTNNSLASFKRKFRKIYNNSPANYIKEKKLERGKKLLIHSQKSIGEICYKCGYADPSSFARSFKNRFGISPLDFRLSQNAH